jgi:FtsZ-interacting cell division protein ZipA
MELIVVILAIACIAWIVWRIWRKKRASTKAKNDAALQRAWRTVLNDPNYTHRRRYEERMHDDEIQVRKDEGL